MRMKYKSIERYLKEGKYRPPADLKKPFNFALGIRLTLQCLIYCAQNDKKIGYKSLAHFAGVPDEYTTGHGLGNIVGKLLGQVGRYCDDMGIPNITSLCVNLNYGLPSYGFIYFDPTYNPDDLELAQSKTMKLYKEIDAFTNWKAVNKANSFGDFSQFDGSNAFIPRLSFKMPKSAIMKFGTKEEKEELVTTARQEEFEQLKLPSRIGATVLLLFGLVAFASHPSQDFNFAWLLWIPMCVFLWNIHSLLKVFPRYFETILVASKP